MDKKLFKDCLLIILYCVLLVVCLVKIDSIVYFFGTLLNLLSSMFLGILTAFLLNAPYRYFKRVFSGISRPKHSKTDAASNKNTQPSRISVFGIKLKKKEKKKGGIASGLALAVTYLLFFAALILLVSFVVPQIAKSVMEIKDNAESYSQNMISYFNEFNNRYLSDIVDWDKLTESFKTLLNNTLSMAGDITSQLISVTTDIVSGVTDFVLGLAFSVYFLLDKDRLRRRASDIVRAFLPEKFGKSLKRAGILSGEVLGSYLVSRVTGALISGLICFTGMSIFGFKYQLLISVVLGLFCILPVFGPVIGCIISELLILLIQPDAAIWYLLFFLGIFILTDKLIMPHLGASEIKLPPLLILFASAAGGYAFGFWGIFLSIPVVTVLSVLVPEYIKRKNGEDDMTAVPKAEASSDSADR